MPGLSWFLDDSPWRVCRMFVFCFPTVDGRRPATAEKPWNNDFPVNTDKRFCFIPMVSFRGAKWIPQPSTVSDNALGTSGCLCHVFTSLHRIAHFGALN